MYSLIKQYNILHGIPDETVYEGITQDDMVIAGQAGGEMDEEKIEGSEGKKMDEEKIEGTEKKMDVVHVSIKDILSILNKKRVRKTIDKQTIDRIVSNRDTVLSIVDSIRELDSKQYFDIPRDVFDGIVDKQASVFIHIDDVSHIEHMVSYSAHLLTIIHHIRSIREDLVYDSKDAPSLAVIHMIDSVVSLDAYHRLDRDVISDSMNTASRLHDEHKVHDAHYDECVDKVWMVVWMIDAYSMLHSTGVSFDAVKHHISDAPASVRSTEVFRDISAHCTESHSNDRDVYNTVYEYMNKHEDIGDWYEGLQTYIHQIRQSDHQHDKTDRIVSAVDKLLHVYRSGDFTECDNVIEQLFELKFYDTKVFKYIEETQKTVDKVKREVQSVQASFNKSSKVVDKSKNKCMLSYMRELDKPDLSKMKDLLTQINLLPASVKSVHTEFIKSLRSRIEVTDKFKIKIRDVKNKYSKNKIVTGKVDSLVTEFDRLVKEYCSLDIGCSEYRKDIEKYSWMVKANCVLEGKVYDDSSKTIEGWKKIIDHIKDWGGPLTTLMESKVEQALSFVKEVDRVKHAGASHSKSDRDKLLTLQDADTLLKEVNKNCKEIDINNEKIYIETIITGVQNKLKHINSDNITMLHDLQNCLEYCKRSPLNLKDELSIILEKEKKAIEFLQRVRELSPESFKQKQEDLQSTYNDLGIKVLEWEDMIAAVSHEEKIIEKIHESLKAGITDLAAIQDIRDQYKDVKYLKDLRLEIRLMVVYLQILRLEFERRQDIIVREESIKPAIDYLLLGALVMELDELSLRINSSDNSLKNDLISLSDNNKYIHELHNDVKRYLDYSVYTLNLESLNTQNIKKIYKKFVDLTGPILDYKINLEIQEREKNQQQAMQSTPYPSKDSIPHKKQAIVLESKYNVDEEQVSSNVSYSKHVNAITNTGVYKDENEYNNMKPVVNRNSINQDLRNYYCKNWKKLMENNAHLDISGLDALMSSKSLEKAIYDKIKKNPLEYDVLCTSITNTLRHVGSYND